jgi:hypothetical protein
MPKDKSKELGYKYDYENTIGLRKRPDFHISKFPRPNPITRALVWAGETIFRKLRQITVRIFL